MPGENTNDESAILNKLQKRGIFAFCNYIILTRTSLLSYFSVMCQDGAFDRSGYCRSRTTVQGVKFQSRCAFIRGRCQQCPVSSVFCGSKFELHLTIGRFYLGIIDSGLKKLFFLSDNKLYSNSIYYLNNLLTQYIIIH